mmetsp:Transcript_18323/g.32095  ORF Transcript_18323/g.32095 Transcript_18323/m.32095 type:complete len:295 (-) Transcript_18323:1008-1892(-)
MEILWKVSMPGCGLGDAKLGKVSSMKTVSSRGISDLEYLEVANQTMATRIAGLEKEQRALKKFVAFKEREAELIGQNEELRKAARIAVRQGGKKTTKKLKCLICRQQGHLQAECSQGGGGLKCWSCQEPGHFARDCNAATKEGADDVSQATMSVHGDANHQEGSDDDSTQVGEVLPAVEKTRDVEQHGGATKGMTFAEVLKRDERHGSSPPLTRPAAGPGRTPPAAPTTRRGPELAGRKLAAGAQAGEDGCWGRSPRSPTCAPSGSAWCRARGGETRRCKDACLEGGYYSTCVP